MQLRPTVLFYLMLTRMAAALILGLMMGNYFAGAIAGN